MPPPRSYTAIRSPTAITARAAYWAAAASGSVHCWASETPASPMAWSNSSRLYGPQFAGRVHTIVSGAEPIRMVVVSITQRSIRAVNVSAE